MKDITEVNTTWSYREIVLDILFVVGIIMFILILYKFFEIISVIKYKYVTRQVIWWDWFNGIPRVYKINESKYNTTKN